jgi:hypothetical protein
MRNLLLRLLPALLILLSCMHSSAQVLTKYGDNVSTLDGIMKAYYDVVTIKKGEKISYERDSLLHIAGALAGNVIVDKDNRMTLSYNTLKDWHKKSDPFVEKTGFYETEIGRKVEKFGGIYHVWSTYESRYEAAGKIIDRGINSIELYFDGSRFWIITWVFDSERTGNPLPAEYLNK